MDQRSPFGRHINERKICIVLLVASLTLVAQVVAASDYSAWRVVSIPGASDIEARGVNDLGQIAGTYTSAADAEHGFLKNKDGSVLTIDVFGSTGTHVYAINNLGQVAGYSQQVGFILDPDGTVSTIKSPNGYVTFAYALNDLGQVAGFAENGAFVTGTDGSFSVFNVLGSVNYSTIAWGINNAGEVVGEYETPLNGGQIHGFLRSSNGTITTIDVPGAIATVATGIDNAGQIAGYYTTAPASYPLRQQNHGFIRDADGTITSFDAPKLGSTQVNGIASSSGMIVANFSHNQQNGPPNIGLVRSCILCP